MTTSPDGRPPTNRPTGHSDRALDSNDLSTNKPPATDPDLLGQVLAETLKSSGRTVSAEDRERLLEVARRYPEASADQEPVVRELVLVMLQGELGRLNLSAEDWQAMAQTVAATLLEAPDTHARLESLWSWLRSQASI